MKPNSTVYANGVRIEGISLRDEPWDVAERTIRAAWEAGYRGLDFDDGLLMFKPQPDVNEALAQTADAQTYPDVASADEAVAIAREVHWIEEEQK